MFIEELVIDGFKSYSTRTVISGFDKEFNAITGLNGSGKSNILDAICFVLGMQQMSQMRAQNTLDLIYKRGQAGINKASVSIVFNNKSKADSPVGYEQFDKVTITRQIAVDGKNKFMINGHLAQMNNVMTLLQSVQLNINNPHFLIMQGKITKVLNMKPSETLAMIEEAAGTRMFEEKKEKARKAIEKKDERLTTIKNRMEQDIAPKLEKMKKEKDDLLRYQKLQLDIEKNQRTLVVAEYSTLKKRVGELEQESDKKRAEWDAQKTELKELKQELTRIETELKELKKCKEAEMEKSSSFKALLERKKELDREITRVNASLEIQQKSLKEEEDKAKKHIDFKKNFDKFKAKYDSEQAVVEEKKLKVHQETERIKKEEMFYQSLLTGVSANEGEAASYQDKIQQANKDMVDKQTSIETKKIELQHVNDYLKKNESAFKKVHKKYQDSQSKQMAILSELDSLKKDAEALPELMNEKSQLEKEISSLSRNEEVSSFMRFGKKSDKIHGYLGEYLLLKDGFEDFGTALDLCAGGWLYSLVVEDKETAKFVLDSNMLARKTVFIPMNDISYRPIEKSKIDYIRKNISNNPKDVVVASELFEKNGKVSRAIEFALGNVIICRDNVLAKKIAYDKNLMIRCITLDGDVYEPGATITGGSSGSNSRNGSQILRNKKALCLIRRIEELNVRLESVIRQISSINSAAKRVHDLESHLLVITSDLNNPLVLEYQKRQTECQEIKNEIKNLEASVKVLEKDLVQIKKDYDSFSSNKDVKLKEIESTIKKDKSSLAKMTASLEKDLDKFEEMKNEFECLQDEAESFDASKAEGLKKDIRELKLSLNEIKSNYETVSSELNAMEEKFARFDKESEELNSSRIAKNQFMHKLEVSVDNMKSECEKVSAMLKEDTARLKNIEKQHQTFLQSHDLSEFARVNLNELKRQIAQHEAELEQLKKRVSLKSMAGMEQIVEKENALKKMLNTVVKDKKMITETIRDLESHKIDALVKTFEKVNE